MRLNCPRARAAATTQSEVLRTGESSGARRRLAHLLRRVVRAEGFVFAAAQTATSQLLILFLNLAVGVITGRLLGPAGRGVLTAATLWPQLLTSLCFIGLPAAIIFYIRSDRAASNSIITATFLLATVLSTIGVLFGLVAAPLTMRGYSPEEIHLGMICVLATIPFMLFATVRQILLAFNLFATFNTAAILAPSLYLLLLLLLWSSIGVTVWGSALALLGSVTIATGWLCWQTRLHYKPTRHVLASWLRRVGSYTARAAAGDLFSGVNSYVDRLVLVTMLPPRSLGIYAVAYSLSRVMFLVNSAITLVLFPTVAGRPKEEIKFLHDHALRLVVYGVMGAVAFSWLFGSKLIILMFGLEFAGAGPIFGILVIQTGLLCISGPVATLFYAYGSPTYVSTVEAVAFIVAVVELVCLTPPFGNVGAAAAMATSAIVRMVMLFVGISAVLKLAPPRLSLNQSDFAYMRSRLRL